MHRRHPAGGSPTALCLRAALCLPAAPCLRAALCLLLCACLIFPPFAAAQEEDKARQQTGDESQDYVQKFFQEEGREEAPQSGGEGGMEDSEAAEPQRAAESIGTLYREGLAYLRQNQRWWAAQTWERLLRRSPYHFNARMGLGKLYLKSDPGKAYPHLKMALQLRPVSDEARYHMGRWLEGQQRYEEAAEEYRKAIRLNARHYAANSRLRDIIRKLRKGKTVVERAAETFWASPSLVSLTLFGRIVMGSSEPRQALMEFELMRERLRDLPEVHLWIARAHRRLGSLKGEIAAYEAYLARNKEAEGVRLLMLERLLAAGEFRKARQPLAALEARMKEQAIGRREGGRFLFLKSRFLVAQGDPGKAGKILLASGKGGFEAVRVGEAFHADVALFPAHGGLWKSYGDWLRHQAKLDEAAGAYQKAAGLKGEQAAAALKILHEFAAGSAARLSANLALGELALARGDQAEAVERLEQIPPGHKQDARASLMLGVIHRGRGELEKSLEAFTRYVFSFPDRAGMGYARGNLFWVMGRKEVAVGMWSKNLAELQQYPQALALIAEHLRKSGKAGKETRARRHLRDATPENVANRIRLGDLLFAQGLHAAATGEWEQASRYKTGDFDLLVRLGKAYLAQEKMDKGAAALRRAAQIGTLELELAEKLARNLLLRRRYEDALDFYWQIYRTHPQHPDLVEALPKLVINAPALPEQRLVAANFADISGRPELAIELLEELLRLHPEIARANVYVARLYVRQRAFEDAELAIEGGVAELGITDVATLNVLAKVQLDLEKTEALADTLRRIVELKPDSMAAAKWLGFLLSEMHRPREARPHLEKALIGSPKDAKLLFYLSRAAFSLGDAKQSEAYLKRLFAVAAEHWQGRALLIRILQKGRRWAELIVQLEKHLAANPEDAEARFSLVSAYLNRFQKEKARPHYEMLRKSNPAKVRTLHNYFR